MAESCYQPRYLQGSYKLVPFKVEDASSEHGRRGAEGEFPFGEQTGYADLGRRIRTYSLRARFDGNNHILASAALIAVCEAPGPGILTHPTRGVILSAACRSLKVSDKVEEEQGVTYVDMEFVEANNWPNGLSLVGQLLGLVLSTVIAGSRASFTSRYKPLTVQPFRQVAVISTAQDQITTIRNEYERATAGEDDDIARQRILLDLDTLRTNQALAAQTDYMDKGLALGMNAVALEITGREKFRVFRNIANGAARVSTFRAPAADAENATFSNVRIIAAAYMAEGALEEQNVRTGEVFDQLDIVDALLEQEMSYAREICDNYLYLQLSEFRTQAVAQLYSKAYDSPGLVEYDFSGNVHPVVAAYAIYGDAKRHRDLEALNIVSSTGRIGPGVAAERGANS